MEKAVIVILLGICLGIPVIFFMFVIWMVSKEDINARPTTEFIFNETMTNYNLEKELRRAFILLKYNDVIILNSMHRGIIKENGCIFYTNEIIQLDEVEFPLLNTFIDSPTATVLYRKKDKIALIAYPQKVLREV
jgi:hypothetical protein